MRQGLLILSIATIDNRNRPIPGMGPERTDRSASERARRESVAARSGDRARQYSNSRGGSGNVALGWPVSAA